MEQMTRVQLKDTSYAKIEWGDKPPNVKKCSVLNRSTK